jgi:hypothetical protein
MTRLGDGSAYWWDPIGAGGFPPEELKRASGGAPVYYNRRSFMPIKSNLCGYYCLLLARALKAAPARNWRAAQATARRTFAGESPREVAADAASLSQNR